MASRKQRMWFVDTHSSVEKFAIVEKGTTSKDGWTSNYESISEALGVRIRGTFTESDLALNAMDGTFSNIPARFHENIVDKVIAQGYKDPRHMDLNTAQYFQQEYAIGVKKAKKFVRSNYQTVGNIRQQDF